MNCKRMRRIRVFYVNMAAQALGLKGVTKGPEWKVRECGNRLSGGTECRSCESGWEVRDNHFAENASKYRKASDELRRTSTIEWRQHEINI